MEPIEDRLAAVENELVQIKRQLAMAKSTAGNDPWDKIFGSFANSEGFDEATRLGREYREAQRLEDQEETA